MQLVADQLYHIYNQGNNHERIFYTSENYLYFLRLFRKFVLPNCDVLCYCLMPNHFHFLINVTEKSAEKIKIGNNEMSQLAKGFRHLLSSYSQAINKQQHRTGALFRQKTKAKLLTNDDLNYPLQCFHYIHQNPLKANLAEELESWEFSSFRDYAKLRAGTLCNQFLTYQLLELDNENFVTTSYEVINPEIITQFYE